MDIRIFILCLVMIMTMGLMPAFAATKSGTSSGTNVVSVCVASTIAISVTDNANWDNLVAHELLEIPESPIVSSESNIPVSIDVSVTNWNPLSFVNMSINTLAIGDDYTPMKSDPKIAIDSLASPVPGEDDNTQNEILNMQVPIGSAHDTYNTSVIWTKTGG